MGEVMRAASGSWLGVEAFAVAVEAHQARGLPGLTVIGLARGPVRESAVRVRAALSAVGLQLGSQRLLVNLMPADVPKEASALDLPMAVALLAAAGRLPAAALVGRRFYGELSLGGELQPGSGLVLLADLARRCGDRELIVPAANAAEAALVPGVRVIGAPSLAALMAHLRGECALAPAVAAAPAAVDNLPCLAEVQGQAQAKWALEVAAAGGHNLLMVGPPGCGKTMLARRLPGILPPLDPIAQLEVARIAAARGGGSCRNSPAPPFRAPHHTISAVGLSGGGSQPRPGEISLAHRGVLFLDELPEFSRRCLECLREPLEEGAIQIARAAGSLRFPAALQLVAAMNPCPCGYHQPGGRRARGGRACICAFARIGHYLARLSGPLLERIDLHIELERVPLRLDRTLAGEASPVVRARVQAARARQAARLGPGGLNARMTAAQMLTQIHLTPAARRLVECLLRADDLSARALTRLLKVARTVADLAAAEQIGPQHVRSARVLRAAAVDGAVGGPPPVVTPPAATPVPAGRHRHQAKPRPQARLLA